MSGATPLATTWGTDRAISSSVANGASRVAVCWSRGSSLTVTSVITASVPSDPIKSCVRS